MIRVKRLVRAVCILAAAAAMAFCFPPEAARAQGGELYGSAAGVWSSEDVGTLHINIKGNDVSGSYKTGVYSGRISNHTITFSWWEYATSFSSADPEDRGSGSMAVSEDWTRLTGSWKSEKGGYSGSFSAAHISKPVKYDTVLNTGDGSFEGTSGKPGYAPTGNYFRYDAKYDQWYDNNGNIIENSYNFEAWMHAGGFTGSAAEGWYNQDIPVTGFAQLYCAYLKTVGCCCGSCSIAFTPAGGAIFAGSSFAEFNAHIFSPLNYNASLNIWTYGNNDPDTSHAPGDETWGPFGKSFPQYMQSMGYSMSKDLPPLYVDSEGRYTSMKKVFDTYCLTNGCRWNSDINAWVSPGMEYIQNPFDLSNYQLPAGKPADPPTAEAILSGMQNIADTAQQITADQATQDAFHTVVSEDGWEYTDIALPGQ